MPPVRAHPPTPLGQNSNQCISEAETRRPLLGGWEARRAHHRAVTYQCLTAHLQWPPPPFNLLVSTCFFTPGLEEKVVCMLTQLYEFLCSPLLLTRTAFFVHWIHLPVVNRLMVKKKKIKKKKSLFEDIREMNFELCCISTTNRKFTLALRRLYKHSMVSIVTDYTFKFKIPLCIWLIFITNGSFDSYQLMKECLEVKVSFCTFIQNQPILGRCTNPFAHRPKNKQTTDTRKKIQTNTIWLYNLNRSSNVNKKNIIFFTLWVRFIQCLSMNCVGFTDIQYLVLQN